MRSKPRRNANSTRAANVARAGRLVFRVVYRIQGHRLAPWALLRARRAVHRYRLKVRAVEDGRVACHTHRARGGRAQLVVHRRDGRIGFESTYGADPRRYPS